jgi:hemerythrin superfamily protein
MVMTILNALKADHNEAKGLLKTILASKDGKKRGELFEQFKTKLTAHSRAEEKVFYRPLEKTEEGKTEALEGAVEHDVVDRLLADLAASRSRQPEAEKWTARYTVLQELVEHHIEEEERDFFKTARKLFDRAALEKMGKDFAAEKSKLEVSVPSTAALRDPSRRGPKRQETWSAHIDEPRSPNVLLGRIDFVTWAQNEPQS